MDQLNRPARRNSQTEPFIYVARWFISEPSAGSRMDDDPEDSDVDILQIDSDFDKDLNDDSVVNLISG